MNHILICQNVGIRALDIGHILFDLVVKSGNLKTCWQLKGVSDGAILACVQVFVDATLDKKNRFAIPQVLPLFNLSMML